MLRGGMSGECLCGSRWPFAQREPFVQPNSRIANRTTLHPGNEIEHVAANPPSALGNTRLGVARPGVLLDVDDETLEAGLRLVGWQRAAPTKIGGDQVCANGCRRWP